MSFTAGVGSLTGKTVRQLIGLSARYVDAKMQSPHDIAAAT
ncbi:hypothetical protein [Nisaea sp.]